MVMFFLGVLVLPFIKFITPSLSPDEPFNSPEYQQMDFLQFAGKYISYSAACLLNYYPMYPYASDEERRIYTNEGQCGFTLPAILGYTLALFVI